MVFPDCTFLHLACPSSFWLVFQRRNEALGELCVENGKSQYLSSGLFSKLRNATNGRFLWLRNNLSTAISQLIDSVIFIAIAFYGVMPLFELILGQWVIKLVIAALDTPLVYAGVAYFRKSDSK